MVSIQPMNEATFNKMLAWSEVPEFKEFFRRFPQKSDWETWEMTKDRLVGFYGIVEEFQVVGVAFLAPYDFHSNSSEVGMLIDSPNRSVVAEYATRQLCEYAFDYLGNDKIVSRVLKHRIALAKRMQDHLGFEIEGVIRQACNGQDELLLGCLKTEYKRK